MEAWDIDALSGKVLDGTFRVDEPLGRGGMGAVFAATHLRTGRRYAVKVLLPEIAVRRDAVARLKREAETIGALGHANVVGVHDIRETDGLAWLVMDLLEAEALGDMLSAETELQRAVLASSAKGHASNEVAHWREAVLSASAAVEQELDFSDDDQDGIAPTPGWCSDARRVAEEMAAWLAVPPAERLREGLRVVLAGPPNSGKSSLFNAILDEAAAIVSPIAGTTRDAIERPVAIGGVPFLLVDTAGLRDEGADEIERIGISRAGQELARADVVLWLGPEGEGPSGVIEVASMMDAAVWAPKGEGSLAVSAVTGEGLPELMSRLSAVGRDRLPKPGQVAVSRRQKQRLETARLQLLEAAEVEDLLIAGEALRQARHALDAMLGTVGTEDMLDSLFGRFCIGK